MENSTYATRSLEFSVGSVFSRTFSTLFGHLAVFVGITLVAWIPSTLLELATLSSTRSGSSILDFILNMVVQGASAYATLQILTGKRVSIPEALSGGSKRLGTLVAASFLAGLGFVFGLVLLIVPGLMLACMWAVVVPVCAVERLGAIDGLKRSAALTKGYRWKILGLTLILYLSIFVLAGAVAFTASLIFFGNGVLVTLVTNAVLLLPQAFGSVMFAIMYYDLRAAKEGVSIDSLANVFD